MYGMLVIHLLLLIFSIKSLVENINPRYTHNAKSLKSAKEGQNNLTKAYEMDPEFFDSNGTLVIQALKGIQVLSILYIAFSLYQVYLANAPLFILVLGVLSVLYTVIETVTAFSAFGRGFNFGKSLKAHAEIISQMPSLRMRLYRIFFLASLVLYLGLSLGYL